MSAMLVRDTPPKVRDWLRTTASENRRSLNQQIIVCLEWCMGQMPREAPPFPRSVNLNGGAATLAEIDRARMAGRR